MAWDDSKGNFEILDNVPEDEKLSGPEWNDHTTDQKRRGYDTVTSVTADHTAKYQAVVLADASGGALTVTLPDPRENGVVTVKKTDASSNAVTVATPNTETIDGDSERTLTGKHVAREIISDGSDYYII